jgi:hypothetical protein
MRTLIGIGTSLLAAATITFLLTNANAGDRLLLVQGTPGALTADGRDARDALTDVLFVGSTASGMQTFTCWRTVADSCDNSEPPVCTPVETLGCDGTETTTQTADEYFAKVDAGASVRKGGTVEYHVPALSTGQRTALDSFLKGSLGVSSLEWMRAFTCRRGETAAKDNCDLTTYQTLDKEAALVAVKAGQVITDFGSISEEKSEEILSDLGVVQ